MADVATKEPVVKKSASAAFRDFVSHQRATPSQVAPDNVIIFDSVPKKPVVPANQPEWKEDEWVRVTAKDGDLLVLPLPVLTTTSVWWQRLFKENQSQYKENETKQISFPEWSGAVLEEIVRFALQEYLVNSPAQASANAARTVFQFEIKPDVAMELVVASHFFEMRPLLQLATKMLAYYIEDVPSFVSMPTELVEMVLSYVEPIKLSWIESQPEINTLRPNTKDIWKTHCSKRKWELCDRNVAISLARYPPLADLVDWERIDSNEGAWKALYWERDLLRKVGYYLTTLAMAESASPPVNNDRLDAEGLVNYVQQVGSLFRRLPILNEFPVELVLPHCKNLVSVDISDREASEGVLLKAIAELSSLKVLALRQRRLSNIRLLSSVIAKLPLESLDLVGLEIAGPVSDLAQGIMQCASLRHISFHRTFLGRTAVESLLSGLKDAKLASFDIGATGLARPLRQEACEVFKTWTSLKHFIIAENSFPLAGYEAVCRGLPASVKTLVFTDTTRMSTALGVIAVLDEVKAGAFRLEYFNLARNMLIGESLGPVLQYLTNEGSSVQCLDLSENSLDLGLTDDLVQQLLKVLAEHKSLQQIDLSRNKIRGDQLVRVAKSLALMLGGKPRSPLSIRVESNLCDIGSLQQAAELLKAVGVSLVYSQDEMLHGNRWRYS